MPRIKTADARRAEAVTQGQQNVVVVSGRSHPLRRPDVVRGARAVLEGERRAVREVEAQLVRGIPFRRELLRLVVHGILHVLGYDHPAGEARIRSPMWRRQERYLRKLR